MDKFFIIGLPRSRTYWLSQFLSSGDCVVEHDSSCEYASIDEMHSKMPQGICDTGLGLVWKQLKGRVIIVMRDYREVVASLNARGMQENPSLRDLHHSLLEASQTHEVIGYNQLKKERVCRYLFESLTGLPFNRNRWARMDRTILTVDPYSEMVRFKHNEANIRNIYGRPLCTETFTTI